MPAAVTLKLVVPVEQIVVFDGCAVIDIGVYTVNDELLVVADGAQVPPITTWYMLPLMATVAPVIVSVAVVAFEYTPPFVMLVKVAPPSVLTCHW